MPTEGLEWSMSDDDDEPILDLVGPQATARPRSSSGLRPSPQANVKVDRKAFNRKLVFKFVAAVGALLFIVCVLTFFIILAVRLINS